MTPDERAVYYRAQQNRQRVEGLPRSVPLDRYLERLERDGALIPGGAEAVRRRVLGQVGDRPPTNTADVVTLLHQARTFLDSDAGRGFRDPLHKGDPDSPELVSELRSLSVPRAEAESFYREHAVDFAGLTGAKLTKAVARHLAENAPERLGVDLGRPDGYEATRRPATTEPATPPPLPWVPTSNGMPTAPGVGPRPASRPAASAPSPVPAPSPRMVMIGPTVYQLPDDQAAKPEPATVKSRHLESIKLAF